MPNIQFGTGTAVFSPSSLNAPQLTNVTPLAPTLLQEISLDFKASNKELYGRYQWAMDVARGKITASGKFKVIATDPNLLNALYFGLPTATGTSRYNLAEPHAVSASVQVTNHAMFEKDGGVVDASTGIPLALVASAPIEGQYSVAAGTYTFAAGETITNVLITYSSTSMSGVTIAITNQLQGYGPEFELDLTNTYEGKYFGFRLYRCKLTDFSLPTKMEDYWIGDGSFSICANAAGNGGSVFADQ